MTLVDWLYPRRCLQCKTVLAKAQKGLCYACFDAEFFLPFHKDIMKGKKGKRLVHLILFSPNHPMMHEDFLQKDQLLCSMIFCHLFFSHVDLKSIFLLDSTKQQKKWQVLLCRWIKPSKNPEDPILYLSTKSPAIYKEGHLYVSLTI